MTKFRQKWALVYMIEDRSRGFTFDRGEWPLHITVGNLFSIDWDSTKIVAELSDLLKSQKPVTTTSLRYETWGDSIEVAVMDTNDELRALHSKIISYLQDNGATFDLPQYLHDGYDAHSTVQKHARLELDREISIDSLTLVDMFPDSDGLKRRLLDTIHFS